MQLTESFKKLLTWFNLVLFTTILCSCSGLTGDKEDEKETGPNQEFELTASSDKIKLTFPEGVLPDSVAMEDVSIDIIREDDNSTRYISGISPDSLEAGINYSDMLSPAFAMDLLPSGLTFDPPLEIEIDRSFYEDLGQGQFFLLSGETMDIIELSEDDMADSSAATITLSISHFSKLIYVNDFNKMFTVEPYFTDPVNLKVNQSIKLPFMAKLAQEAFQYIVLNNRYDQQTESNVVDLYFLNSDRQSEQGVSGEVRPPSFIETNPTEIPSKNMGSDGQVMVITKTMTCVSEGEGDAYYQINSSVSDVQYENIPVNLDDPLEPGKEYSSLRISAEIKRSTTRYSDFILPVRQTGSFKFNCTDELPACDTSEPDCNETEPFCNEASGECIIPEAGCDAADRGCSEIIDCSANECDDPGYSCNADVSQCIAPEVTCPEGETCLVTEVSVFVFESNLGGPIEGAIVTVTTGTDKVTYVTDSEGLATVQTVEGSTIKVEHTDPGDSSLVVSDEISEFPENDSVFVGLDLIIPIDDYCPDSANCTTVSLDLTVESQETHGIRLNILDSAGNVVAQQTVNDDSATQTVDVPEGGTLQVEYLFDGESIYTVDITDFGSDNQVEVVMGQDSGFDKSTVQEVTVTGVFTEEAGYEQQIEVKVLDSAGNQVSTITMGSEQTVVNVPEGGKIVVDYVIGDGQGSSTTTKEFSEFGDNNTVLADFSDETIETGDQDITVTVKTTTNQAYEGIQVVVLDKDGELVDSSVTDATGKVVVTVPEGGFIAVTGLQPSGSETITRTVVVKDFGTDKKLDLAFYKAERAFVSKSGRPDVNVNVLMPDSVPANMAKIVNSSSCNQGSSSSSTFYPKELEVCKNDETSIIPWYIMYDADGNLIGYNMAECDIAPTDTEIDCDLSEIKTDFQSVTVDLSDVQTEGVKWITGLLQIKLAGSTKSIRMCVKAAGSEVPEVFSYEDCQVPTFNTTTKSYEILIPPASSLLQDSVVATQSLVFSPTGGIDSVSRSSTWGGTHLLSGSSLVIPGGDIISPPDNLMFDPATSEYSWTLPEDGLQPAHVMLSLRCTDAAYNITDYNFISATGDTAHIPVNIPENPVNLTGCTYNFSITSTAAPTIDATFRNTKTASGGNNNARSYSSVAGVPDSN